MRRPPGRFDGRFGGVSVEHRLAAPGAWCSRAHRRRALAGAACLKMLVASAPRGIGEAPRQA